MKKIISIFFTVLLVFSCVFTAKPSVYAAKATQTRAIAIVFDNSGSMYLDNNKAWCQATYAMEVFASMLNEGDTLYIYPMHPIKIGDKVYTMDAPYSLTNASQAAEIRSIFTPKARGTPIETIDKAAVGLKAAKADKKYMIVLTDGDTFHMNDLNINASKTREELDARFKKYAGETMTVMYLGIGPAIMPDTPNSDYFLKNKAEDSKNVLSVLTDMCNRIFGRDTLPKNRIKGKNINFDISMKKLIVFVQGKNVSNVKLTGGAQGQQISAATTKYGTKGSGDRGAVPDTSLQGMMVTYENFGAGDYTIEYDGDATSIEVYYEPDADLQFVFTDAKGKNVDPKELYEGKYKVSFGMKDAKTGELISSDLLGKPHYEGTYTINGKETPFTFDGAQSEVAVTLKMDDTFDANLTVTYLSGYTISKDSSDFGWPKGGITVNPKPAGDFEIKISGGADSYSLTDLEKGEPFKAEIFYKDKKLTGADLEKVELTWDENTSNAKIEKEFAQDHYILRLKYKDSANPTKTACGKSKVFIHAKYAEPGSKETKAQATLVYEINDNSSPLELILEAPEDYIVISDLDKSKEIIAELKLNGAKLSEEDFEKITLTVESDIACDYKLDAANSRYLIKLKSSEGIDEGDYPVKVKVEYKDNIGRTVNVEDSVEITLSNTPLWVKWVFWIGLILLILFIIWRIMRIRVLPKKGNIASKDSSITFAGKNVSSDATFDARISGGMLTVWAKYADTKVGVKAKVKPGRESYLSKPNKKRSADVVPSTVKAVGSETIRDAVFDYSVIYELNKDNGKLERNPEDPKPFTIKNGSTIDFSGTMLNKPFSATISLNFNKK